MYFETPRLEEATQLLPKLVLGLGSLEKTADSSGFWATLAQSLNTLWTQFLFLTQ